MALTPELRAAFLALVDRNGPQVEGLFGQCWLWSGPRNGNTPRLELGGERIAARAVAWEVYFGTEAPPRLYLLCRTKGCVCPTHHTSFPDPDVQARLRQGPQGGDDEDQDQELPLPADDDGPEVEADEDQDQDEDELEDEGPSAWEKWWTQRPDGSDEGAWLACYSREPSEPPCEPPPPPRPPRQRHSEVFYRANGRPWSPEDERYI
jgi:hypothetical protein